MCANVGHSSARQRARPSGYDGLLPGLGWRRRLRVNPFACLERCLRDASREVALEASVVADSQSAYFAQCLAPLRRSGPDAILAPRKLLKA